MIISKAIEADFDQMIEVWESSVRATHGFLAEEDIVKLRGLIRNEVFYINSIEIYVLKDLDKVIGFVGTSDVTIQMLFISPNYFGKTVGRILLKYALENKKCTKVEVNEQNPRALRFYQKHGFQIKARSELDHQGNPFPILFMEL
ncbi:MULTISPECIES: GNAT family N-acetyltransferase [Francisella]|uniref:Acetyltransferase family protein n=1 Tax=Francisella philomiragia TaxID=28110 RepID=A0A0B6D507_9GAMM|nr:MULTISPECIES: GNAT family N-acetyltransferase [Francisella]AJI53926.1 acetyltransferase family protein [Francisella philomiragia]